MKNSELTAWTKPAKVKVYHKNLKGTWLADVDQYYFSKMVDAYLYLGPADLMLAEPRPAEIFLNKEYMAELSRRGSPQQP